jgi:hypothetical protein
MSVLVIKINWYLDIPIATVYSTVSGGISYLSLLHRSFVQRQKIGVGSEIHVSEEGCLVRVIKSSGQVLLPTTNTVFDRWFLFKTQLEPYISHGYARILFVSGIETIQELRDRKLSIGKIRGIGPVTSSRIQSLFEPHK